MDACDSGSDDGVLGASSLPLRPRSVGRPRGAEAGLARENEGRRTALRGFGVTEKEVVTSEEVDPDELDDVSVETGEAAGGPRVRGANPRRIPALAKATLPPNLRVVVINPADEVLEEVGGVAVVLIDN